MEPDQKKPACLTARLDTINSLGGMEVSLTAPLRSFGMTTMEPLTTTEGSILPDGIGGPVLPVASLMANLQAPSRHPGRLARMLMSVGTSKDRMGATRQSLGCILRGAPHKLAIGESYLGGP